MNQIRQANLTALVETSIPQKEKNQNTVSCYTEFPNDVSNFFKLFECFQARSFPSKLSNRFIY